MTERDLTTLVREHVAADEPPFPAPDAVLAAGRRRVRGRRLLAGSVAAAVVAGMATAGVLTLGDRGPSGLDPAGQHPLDDYDAQRMPEILEQASRDVFDRSVPDLGEGDFGAGDWANNPIGSEHYDKATSMGIRYGSPAEGHRWSLRLQSSVAEGDLDDGLRRQLERSCAGALRQGGYLVCRVEALANGDLRVERMGAVRPLSVGLGTKPYLDLRWHWVTRDRLDDVAPDQLWFRRAVEVFKTEAVSVSASEAVQATSLEEAQEALVVPAADLAELASDPRLVIPQPPPDPGGDCLGWTHPDHRDSCG